MIKNLSSVSRNKSSVFLLVLALIVGGVGVQATGLLNTASGGYLVCINSKTKVVTYPGTTKCPTGSKKLVLGAQGIPGVIGLTGATGLSGKDGADGKDGKTLWNGTIDPINAWGAPGDVYINSVTKTLFGPKSYDGTWPVGVSLVGPKGDQGPIGLTGLTGAQGPIGLTGLTGAQGPGGGSGPAGATGANGTNATIAITELYVCDGTDAGTVADEKCKIGMTGPGGGIVFFIDYQDQYASFCAGDDNCNYLEASPANAGENTHWCSNSSTLLGLDAWSNGAVGAGRTNTETAGAGDVPTCTTGAIRIADDYIAPAFNGVVKEDWWLPSISELILMYNNLRQAGVGVFTSAYYWSSTEARYDNAWTQYFFNGTLANSQKGTRYYVRPVRAF